MKWLLIFATLCLPTAHADHLTVYAMPSPSALKWATPARLAYSALWNQLRPDLNLIRHEFGHAIVQYQCGGVTPEVLAGMTGFSTSEAYDQLVRRKAGLGILFHRYSGWLQDQAELKRDLSNRMKRGTVTWIRFQINHESCVRISRFHREFSEQGAKIPYGLSLQPRKREGATGASFAVTFAELAGVLSTQWRSQWTRILRVPNQFIGDDQTPVPLSKIFGAHEWAEPQVPNRYLEFWDPGLMYRTILAAAAEDSRHVKMKIDNAVGIEIDARKVPTPNDPIWQ